MTTTTTNVQIGTSGWQYDHWRNGFYPTGLAKRDWLPYYADRFQTLEINSAFYRLPTPETFRSWCHAVPPDFRFAVKASRYITHVKRLKDSDEAVKRLTNTIGNRNGNVGPILLQLPPNLEVDHESLRKTVLAFPKSAQVALEVRHPSWYGDATRRLLEDLGAAWVIVDPANRDRPDWRTADWGYVRFHRGTGRPASCYNPGPLRTIARHLADVFRSSRTVYCYFNNDGHGCAPRDARRFAAAVERAGLSPSRVPGPRETPVG